ncbi:hypothetical protein WD019_21470, partial [Fictibacillus sp. Mic-4]
MKTGDGMVRVNTRISKEINDWLDAESSRSGVSKSTLIYLALEHYITQKKALTMVHDFSSIV